MRLPSNNLLPQPSMIPGGLRTRATLAAVLVLTGVALVWGQAEVPPDAGVRPGQSPAGQIRSTVRQDDNRIREGTEFNDQAGYFRITGNRVTFFTADGRGRFMGLENLNLERISRAISNNPAQLEWMVSGEITEYRGANFLLVHRAILTTGSGVSKKGEK